MDHRNILIVSSLKIKMIKLKRIRFLIKSVLTPNPHGTTKLIQTSRPQESYPNSKSIYQAQTPFSKHRSQYRNLSKLPPKIPTFPSVMNIKCQKIHFRISKVTKTMLQKKVLLHFLFNRQPSFFSIMAYGYFSFHSKTAQSPLLQQ